MQQMPLEILVTNDDGYFARGINFLAKLLSHYGNVTVVAPKETQSGMSTALSLGKVLRFETLSVQEQNNGNTISVHTLTGSPADCVKMAMNKFYLEKKPDFVFSGINHGSNASVASVYSGTLGAAAEGTIYGIPSIGISVDSHKQDIDFEEFEEFLQTIVENIIEFPPAPGRYLNINMPYLPKEQINGIRFASQGEGMWIKEFEQRRDPYGKDYYWMTGQFLNLEEERNRGDHNLLADGYITIVPHMVNNTDYNEVERLGQIWKI